MAELVGGRCPRVVVTDASLPIATTVARSLGRAGWHVVGASPHRLRRPLRSRYYAATALVPDPEARPDLTAAAIARVARAHRADLVIPTSDKSIVPIAESRNLFEGIKLAIADDRPLSIARDKYRTTELARSVGVEVPASVLVTRIDQLDAALSATGTPVVVKPLQSHQRDSGRMATRSVTYASSAADLAAQLDRPDIGGLPVLVQERVTGDGVGVELLIHDGEPVAVFQHRRIHEVPLSGGMSSLRVSESPDDDLVDRSVRLLRAMGWEGAAMVEFKLTADGPRLLEVNGRLWGSVALPTRAGVDFPLLVAEQALFGATRTHASAVPGVECRSLGLEMRWLAAAVTERLTSRRRVSSERRDITRSALALLDPRHQFDLQVLDDPGPGVLELLTAPIDLGRDAMRKLGAGS